MEGSKKQQQQQQQQATKSSISELPDIIHVNILSRLPLKAIHICRCVCKSWLNLSSDPYYFADTHFKLSATCLLAHPFLVENIINPMPINPFLLDCIVPIPNEFGRDAIIKFNPNAILSTRDSIMVNSCNGLVCFLCPALFDDLCVCNPISGEYVMIPSQMMKNTNFYSFGFSPKSNKFKVVHFRSRIDYRSGLETWKVFIYTVGMDYTWRRIGIFVDSLGGEPADVLLNGRLHWVVTDDYMSEFILCFDFDCEGFQSVLPPKEFGDDHKRRSFWMSLGVVDDCLCLCDYSIDNYFDIWVMKEYGIQESWTKKFAISVPIACTARLKNSSVPFTLLDIEKCLIFLNYKLLISYNLEEKRFTEVEVGRDGQNIYRVIAYKPSFIMLKEIARRQHWEQVNIRKHIW